MTDRSRVRVVQYCVACVLLSVPAVALVSTPRRGEIDVIAPPRSSTTAPSGTIITSLRAGPLVGQRAPDVELTTFAGERVELVWPRERPVVVNFFASWCPSCKDELPRLGALAAVLYSRIDFVGLAVRDSSDAARRLVESIGVGFPTAHDTDDELASAFLVLGVPGTIVIGADGVISADWRGPVPPTTVIGFLRSSYPREVGPALGDGGG